MKILVIHYDKLVERKIHILKQFNNHGLNDFEFVSNHGKDKLTVQEKSRFKNLTDGEISLMLHHFAVQNSQEHMKIWYWLDLQNSHIYHLNKDNNQTMFL